MTTGYVLFDLEGQMFATPLDEVREIVRLGSVEPLPGARHPLTGMVVVRSTPLPVLDARVESGGSGDALVVTLDADRVAVAVDKVHAVVSADELPAADEASHVMPSYVVGVRRHGSDPVLLIDLRLLLDTIADGWRRAVV